MTLNSEISATRPHTTLPVVSVVIPSYNCAAYLARAVQSANALSGVCVDIIVIDDGSTDSTPAVVADLQQCYANVHALYQPNAGLSVARNSGITRSRGEYIVLLDADDELLPLDLGRILIKRPDIVRIGVEEVVSAGKILHRREQDWEGSGRDYLSNHFAANDFYTASCAYVYRREWISKHQLSFAPGLLHEDNLFTVQALKRATHVQVVPDLLYRYIRRPGSITLAPDEERLLARIAAYAEVAKLLTAEANADPTFDLRWKIQEVLDGAQSLAKGCRRRKGHAKVWAALTRFMLTYRGFGGHGFRFEQRARFKHYATAFWTHRPSTRSIESATGDAA